MASFRYLVFSGLSLLLFGCAQIGTLSGGEKDTSAPKPIEDKTTPPSASTNFSSNKIKITFDEFFKLNNPNQNVKMVPPHAQVNVEMKGKTLALSWKDTLKSNQTYAIYLNGAIKDLTEGNDSTMQYVFSTGSVLDSLTYTVSVVDAYSNAPMDKILVALFHPETKELISFNKTNNKGLSTLNYLAPGNYELLAFNDLNGDLELQPNEHVGFPNKKVITIHPDSANRATEPLLLFNPEAKPEIRTIKYVPPGSIIIGSTQEIKNETLYLNGNKVNSSQYIHLNQDSLKLFVSADTSFRAEIILNSDLVNDTVSCRVVKGRKKPVLVKCINSDNTFSPSESIRFEVGDLITMIDTSKVTILNEKDSSLISNEVISWDKNEITLNISWEEFTQIQVEFGNQAIQTVNGSAYKTNYPITLNPARKYGSIIVALNYESSIILELYDGTGLVEKLMLDAPNTPLTISELSPGNYTFRVILDENGNGKWDTGNYERRKQPETIEYYSKPTTVRANWDVEVELIPISEVTEEDEESTK
ncbi:MAG: Ig-like domain-containing protein [Crocinitomicaceae bacterium]|nr:Ig-like domain-containing protein [Crocinitomicaceae bacterium]